MDPAEPTFVGRLPLACRVIVVFLAVFVSCLFGIWSRASLPLASFWTANAVLLGLFVRWPSLRHWLSWTAAVVAYLLADLLTGSELEVTVAFTVANLMGPIVGLAIYQRLPENDRRLKTPDSIMKLVLVALTAGVASAVPGSLGTVAYFDLSIGNAFMVWVISEMASHLLVLPVMLSMPSADELVKTAALRRSTDRTLGSLIDRFGPALAVAATFMVSLAVGGPGSLMFCIPALLWSAIRSGVFETACLSQVTVAGYLVALAFGYSDIDLEWLSPTARASVQGGLATLSLGPLIAAVATGDQQRKLRAVERIADRDGLTGVLTRRAFLEAAEDVIQSPMDTAVMMLDVDHFKAVNDTYGHAAGDSVLRLIADALTQSGRDSDLIGRMGGEEFALVLPGIHSSMVYSMAETLRLNCAEAVRSRLGLEVTVSIGLCIVNPTAAKTRPTLAEALAEADAALYRAKRNGRNQTVVSGSPLPT